MHVLVHTASSVMPIIPSDVVAFQEVGPLQHFDVALVDFEGRAESDGQARQDVAALHQEERLPVNFLLRENQNA